MARVVIPGVWHHITQRGNRRQPVFFRDSDRNKYLELLGRNCARYGVKITGYCLMTNHVHVLAVPERESSLARALGLTHNDYARWLNVTRGDTGHLWQSRYYSCPMDEHHQWAALRYVELNPVRAGLAPAPEDCQWSSAAAHAGLHRAAPLLDMADWRDRWCVQGWRAALSDGMADAALVEEIRQATRTGRPAGTMEFVEAMERNLGRRLRPEKRGRKPAIRIPHDQPELGKLPEIRN